MANRTSRQQLAGRELRLRRENGIYRDPPHRGKSRPFGNADDKTLRRIAANPDPDVEEQFRQQEAQRRRMGGRQR